MGTLKALRKSGKNIFFKTILVLLLMAFLLLGFDSLFSSQTNTAAKVGKEFITLEDLKIARYAEISKIKSMLGENPSKELLDSLNINDIALANLVNQKLLENLIKDLNLLVSDRQASSEIQNNSTFFNKIDQFDIDIFRNILRSNNIPEAKYVSMIKTEIAQKYLADIFTNSYLENEFLEKALIAYENQQAVYDYYKFSIHQEKVKISQKEIEEYYSQNSMKFKSPELREIKYFSFTTKDIKIEENFTEEDLKKEYNDNISDYTEKETRDVYNLIFPSKEEAEKARKELILSKDFLQDSKKFLNNTSKEQFLLVNLSRDTLEEEIRNAIFYLDLNKISLPVQSPLGYHLFKVSAIHPEKVKDFFTIKDTLKTKLLQDRAQEKFVITQNEIDDELSSGATIEEIVAKYNLTLKKTDLISAKGNFSNGKEAYLPKLDNFLTIAFANPINTNSEISASSQDSEYFITRCDHFIPEKIKTIDEAYFEISQILTAQKQKTILDETIKINTDKLISEYKNLGLDLAEKANQHIIMKDILSQANENYDELFNLKPGQVTKPFILGNSTFSLMKLQSINFSSQAKQEEIKAELKDTTVNSIFGEVMHYLRAKFLVQKNPDFVSIK